MLPPLKRKPKRFGYCSIIAEASRRQATSWRVSSKGDTCYVSFTECGDARAFSELFESYFLAGREGFIVLIPMVIGASYNHEKERT